MGEATAEQAVIFQVWRGNAEQGKFTEYQLNAEAGMVVLDAMRTLQATQANDLAIRWNCKAGKCGSCSAEINGIPRLMCTTRINGLPADQPITVAPLRTFPLIRDLVSDVSFNYSKTQEIPSFEPGPAAPAQWRMYQEDVDRIREFHKCIECFLCQDVCHVIRDHQENKVMYSGPRAMVRLASLEMHPLDVRDRIPFAKERAGIAYCNVTKCCSEVCPEGIKITDNAIIPLKERVVDRFHDPLVRLARIFHKR